MDPEGGSTKKVLQWAFFLLWRLDRSRITVAIQPALLQNLVDDPHEELVAKTTKYSHDATKRRIPYPRPYDRTGENAHDKSYYVHDDNETPVFGIADKPVTDHLMKSPDSDRTAGDNHQKNMPPEESWWHGNGRC